MRSLSTEAKEERRRPVARLRERGLTCAAIAERTGPARTGVFDIRKRAGGQSAAGLVVKPAGRKQGTDRALAAEHEAKVQKFDYDKTPDRSKMGFALSNRAAARWRIRERFEVKPQVRVPDTCLGREGFTPQKPVKRAHEQRTEAVQERFDEEYPQVAARAKDEDAEIHSGDETRLHSDVACGRSYAPVEQTPVILVANKRENVSMISPWPTRAR